MLKNIVLTKIINIMKKQLSILMLLAAFFVPWVANAQETLTVYDGTNTNTHYPVNGLYVDTRGACNEFIIPASQLTEMVGATISRMTFYLSSPAGATWPGTIQIYLGETTATSVSSFATPTASTVTMVYSGPLDATGTTMTINFTTPYVYDGGNLLIGSFIEATCTYKSATFYGVTQTDYTARYRTSATAAGTQEKFIPKTTFSYESPNVTCKSVKNLQIVKALTTPNSMTLSWSDTSTTNQDATYTIVNMADTSILAAGITDTFYTFTTLTSNTSYVFGVYAKCSATDSSRIAKVSGRTPCEAIETLPYSYGFDDASTSGATGTYNPCWTRCNSGLTTNYPYPYSSVKRSGLYSLAMNSTTSAVSWTALPAFTENISNLYLNFWAYKTTAAQGHIVVGVMSDPDSLNTFDTVKVIQVQALSTWEQFDVDLSNYTGTGLYIAFLSPKVTNNVYIDDITVMETPACVRPQAMRVEDVADATATVSWNPSPTGAIGYTVKYRGTTDFDPETATDVTTLNISNGDTVANLTGLTGQTTYYVKVASNCGVAGTSLWSQTSFKTRCTAIATESLPYTYNVNDNTTTGATSTINACWTRGTNYSTLYPQGNTTYKHGSTGRCLYFYSTSTYYSYAAMPAFEAPLNTLMVSFWALKTSDNYGHVTVGVMSNPDDFSTFEAMASVQVVEKTTSSTASNQKWEKFEVPLVNYTGTGRYIAIVAPMGVTNYVYVDDISVDVAPNCLPAEQLHMAAVSGTSATLEWASAGEYSGYRVLYDTADFDPDTATNLSEEMVTSTSVTLGNLTAKTTYYVYVQTLCTTDDTVGNVNLSFTTLCDPIADLPWTFNPDGMSTTTTATEFECFNHLGGGYNNIATRTGFTGNTVRFYGNSIAKPNVLILPEFSTQLSNLYMIFKLAPGTTTAGSFSVGYITDPLDSTTFVAVNTYPASAFNTTGSIAAMMLDATFADAPSGARIAFRQNVPSGATTTYWSLDEVTVMMMPACFRPDSVMVTYEEGASVTFNIYSQNSSEYIIYFSSFNCETCDTTFLASSSVYELEGIVGGKMYSGMVYSYCNGDTSALGVPFTFSIPITTYPWTENFDGVTNINQLGTWNRYTGLYNDTAAFTLSATTSGWNLYSAHGLGGSQHMKINIYGTTVKYWLMTPAFKLGSDMELSFDYSLTKYNSDDTILRNNLADDRFIVFLITEDTNFVPLAKWGSDTARDDYAYAAITNTVNTIRLSLANYEDSLVRFAFYGESTLTGDDNDMHIDNLYVGEAPTCDKPTDLVVSNVTSTTAAISWVDTVNVGSYEVTYWPAPDNDESTVDDTIIVPTTETELLLESLDPDRIYNVMVQADCGVLSQPTNVVTFRTKCIPIAAEDLPYVENFDSYNSGTTATISTCWTKGVFGSTTQYPYPYTSAAITGTRGLYFYSTSSIYDYAAMPLFETDLNDLMLSFSMKRYNSSTYTTLMLVGVMSDPNDITTFDTVATFDLRNEPLNSVHRLLVSLENYDGNGSYIAFMAPKSSTTNYVYLDSVVVDSLPDCRWPSDLVVDTVTTSSATLSWTGTGSNFLVQASASPDFDSIVATATSTIDTATVTGLDDYTQYYFRVRAVCGDTSSFWSNTVSAITPLNCGTDFETAHDTLSYGTSTSYSAIIPGYSSYSYGASWHIYTAAELADLGMTDTLNYIRGISVETGTVSGSPIRFRVYMATTSLNEWHSSTSATSSTGVNDTLPISSMQLVYDGSVTFAANSWNDIAFNSSFPYNGEDNLVVAFVRDVPVSGTTYFKYGSTATYATVYKYTSSTSSYTYRYKYGANMAFITCNHVTNCPKPLDVVLSNAAADGFDVAWTGSAEGYTVVVSMAQIDPSTAVASDSVMILTPTTNQVTVSGLAPQTTYYVYLRSDCGIEHSTWATGGSIMTLCTPKTIPFHENFDGMANLSNGDANAMVGGAPTCWDMVSDTTGSFLALYSSTSYRYGNSGYSLKFKAGANNKSTFAIMPEFTQPISVLEVSFQTRPEGTSASSGDFYVGYMTDPTDPATFVATDHYSHSDFSGAYQEKSVTFPSAPAGARIAFRHTPTGSGWFWFLDEVDVHLAPTCPRPDSLTVNMLADGSARVKWVDHRNSNISYEVEYGEAGFEHGYGTSLVTTADSVIISNLPNTRYYEVYVRALCSEDDHSTWTSPVSFATPCGNVSLPYSIDWENETTGSTNVARCWARFNNGGSTQYPYVNNSNAHNGSKAVYFYFATTSGYADDEAYISPAIDTANYPINNIEITFWAKSTVANKLLMVGVMSGTANMSTFTMIDTVRVNTTYAEYTLNTAAYNGNGDRIVFRAMWDHNAAYSVYVDEVLIDQMPPCPRVYDLTAAHATQNSVELAWTDPTTTTTTWVVEYKAVGVSDATAQTAIATSNPFTLTGLSPRTTYNFRVAPVCASGDTSFYSREAGRFTTSQVPAQMPYSYNFENANEWANWQTASNNNVKWYRGTVAAGNTTNAMYLSADEGATNSWRRDVVTNVAAYRDIDFGSVENSYEVHFNYHGGGHYAGNFDGVSVLVVDPTTEVTIPSAYLNSPWGRINYVQARMDTLWGEHVARLDGVSGVKRVVFYHFNNAETHDTAYLDIAPAIDNISIVPQACVRPYDLVTENITSNAATLTWTGDSTALYRIEYMVNGSNVEEFDTVTGPRYRVIGLQPKTEYKWWVQKICSLTATDTSVSAWSVSATFTTNCGSAPLPYSESFEGVEGTTYSTAGVLPDCWMGYTNGNSKNYFPHVTGSGSYHYPHDSTNCLTMTSGSGADYGNTKIAVLPNFAPPVYSLTMTFWYRMENASYGTLTVGYVTDLDDLENSFVAVKTMENTTAPTKDSVVFDTVSVNAKRLAFRWEHNSTYYSVGVDEINVWSDMEECEAPNNFVVNAAYNSAEITWVGEAENYEVYFRQGNWREPEFGTEIDTNVYNVNGLSALTTYSLGVRSICAPGYYSEWNFTTFTTPIRPCPLPTGLTAVPDYNSATISWIPGSDETDWTLRVVRVLDNDTNYYYCETPSYTLTGLPVGMTYNVAVMAVCDAATGSESAYTDTVNFTTLTCEMPTNVAVTPGLTTATVTWEGTADSYEVNYGLNGFNQGTGEFVIVNTNSLEITGLEPETDYDVYVRAICGTGIFSGWTSTFTFTTEVGVTYTVTVRSNNDAWGTVTGGGTFEPGEQTTIKAIPNPNYKFVKWNDENTDSVRTITVTADVTFTATFAPLEGIAEVNGANVTLYPNPASTTVTLEGIEGVATVTVVDMNGREVYRANTNGDLAIDLTGYAKGAYFVRVTGERVNAIRKLIVR